MNVPYWPRCAAGAICRSALADVDVFNQVKPYFSDETSAACTTAPRAVTRQSEGPRSGPRPSPFMCCLGAAYLRLPNRLSSIMNMLMKSR